MPDRKYYNYDPKIVELIAEWRRGGSPYDASVLDVDLLMDRIEFLEAELKYVDELLDCDGGEASRVSTICNLQDRAAYLASELARYVPTDDTLETFTAGDGLPGIRERTDLYEKIDPT